MIRLNHSINKAEDNFVYRSYLWQNTELSTTGWVFNSFQCLTWVDSNLHPQYPSKFNAMPASKRAWSSIWRPSHNLQKHQLHHSLAAVVAEVEYCVAKHEVVGSYPAESRRLSFLFCFYTSSPHHGNLWHQCLQSAKWHGLVAPGMTLLVTSKTAFRNGAHDN